MSILYSIRKTAIVVLPVVLLVFVQCQKDPTTIQVQPTERVYNTEKANSSLHEVARALSLAIQDPAVRQFIKRQTDKQFDYDHDVLFRFVSDYEITTATGKKKFKYILLDKINQLSGEAKEIGYLDQLVNDIPNLQISVTHHPEDWMPDTYIPKVVVLPLDYNARQATSAKGYDSQGNPLIISDDVETSEPFIVVREAERVDRKGRMRVSRYDIVIPEEERSTMANEVWKEVEFVAESGRIKDRNDFEPIVVRVDDTKQLPSPVSGQPVSKAAIKEFTDRLQATKGTTDPYVSNKSARTECVIPATPEIKELYPNGQTTVGYYKILIRWTEVPGATHYRVYRDVQDKGTFVEIARINSTPGQLASSYLDQAIPFNGIKLDYAVKAFNGTDECSSAASVSKEVWTSWRPYNGMEKIYKVYVDNTAWSWMIELFDNKIELEIRTIRYDLENKSVEFPSSWLGQRTSNQQKGKWHSYGRDLFNWDVKRYGTNYMISMIEDDGDGDGVTITYGWKTTSTQKTPTTDVNGEVSGQISYKISEKDENIGFIIINHWDGWVEYSFAPLRGSVKMKVSPD